MPSTIPATPAPDTPESLGSVARRLFGYITAFSPNVPQPDPIPWTPDDIGAPLVAAAAHGAAARRLAGDARHGLVNVERIMRGRVHVDSVALAQRATYEEYKGMAERALDQLIVLADQTPPATTPLPWWQRIFGARRR
ncbi:hypothetical protein [Roseisolibacter agri]|uniref:Uncharacterized protein n=1 Tax=Roseisolibacter agri TaxID=2014610 RepID=A0AA37QKM3_9BACT|nr:hypothetical protein [Roseisolibacter agri]GLC28290.1 hypothetical protein rosag_48030 [Roseisolibacter agri]